MKKGTTGPLFLIYLAGKEFPPTLGAYPASGGHLHPTLGQSGSVAVIAVGQRFSP
jgi:hypothetical protein